MKSRLLAGMIAVMTLSGISASVTEKSDVTNNGSRNTRIIVEVNQDLANMSKDEIFASQDKVINAISHKVTSNFELIDRYSVLNNAFVVEVNSDNVEAIRALEDVASVTIDKIHAKEDISDGSYYSATFARPQAVAGEDTGEMVDNISAETMNKPALSNEGEGTVIAILDNEFYLRGEHQASADDDGTAWNHAVYKPLDASVAKKFTFENLAAVLADEDNPTHAQRLRNAQPGEEGSLYFNSKVPFYFDYGGESTNYGKVGPMDYDVSSNLTYHGSHVASIASANADTYKGIAPKAQLACMKVFTTYIANETGEQMGFGTSTGAYDTAILSAIEDAILLGVDGINMSLGSDLNDFDTDSITMKTLKSLAEDSGIMSAISAGNAGKSSYSFTGGYGNWTTDMVETGILGSYANSTENTIIASGQPTKIYFENAIQILNEDKTEGVKNVAFEDQIVNREGLDAEFPDSAQHWMIKDIVGENLEKIVDWQYVPGFGTTEDYSDLNVRGKVVAVNRGSTSFAEKYNVAVKQGAIGVIIINNDPTATDFNFRCSFGEGFSPTIPCALALYKDKPTFESINHGSFKFIQKDTSVNDLARTISTYSTDGARFDYTLKPDITTPGENIRGAVPPQKKEHRDETPLSTYEYLSGTSMAAPNYAGAQSLMLSKKAKDVYADGVASSQELADLIAFRKTVDMRLMSTANPMLDPSANPEDGKISYTSPRMQGAGMVDLGKAYNSDIYLEGVDAQGNGINKTKIQLANNDDIAKGDIKLSFKAYNDSASAQKYQAVITVMRPAIVNSNKIIQSQYNYKGEVDDLSKISGLTYVTEEYNSATHQLEPVLKTNPKNNTKQNDVIKVTKQIKYYTTIADFTNKTNEKVFEQDYYYNAATSGANWQVLPGYDYQSVQDVVLFEDTQEVTIPANANGTLINLNKITIPEETRQDILSKYEYGCAIEGFVELKQSDERKLSLPFLGFYSGADVDANKTLTNAPVVEPFDFEKDPSVVYPSDLVNDVTNQLVGKEAVDYGSSWTVGYAETVMDVNTDRVLTNDANFSTMNGFHKIGMDPSSGKYFDDVENNLYVGNPEKTNTMIIHQYVMRSVKDNFFTIKNEQGEIVYKSILEDMLFGDKELYKSHVDANYLSAGYVAHRAYAIIPLYDNVTHKAFADGKYTIEFNYQLQYDSNWVKKSYNFIIDSTSPEFTGVEEYTDDQGEARVRISISDNKIVMAKIGYRNCAVKYDEEHGYYIDESKETINEIIEQIGETELGQKRLFVKVTDAAYGETSAIIHFFGNTYSNYVMAQGSSLTVDLDFVKDGQTVTWSQIAWDGAETEVTMKDYVRITTSFGEDFTPKANEDTKGCGGSIIAGSLLASMSALVGMAFLISKKRKNELED